MRYVFVSVEIRDIFVDLPTYMFVYVDLLASMFRKNISGVSFI